MDYGEYQDNPYLVMPYLAGGTLKDKLKALGNKPMPYQEAARLLLPIAYALEYAHEKDTIHRDVKPANILLTDKGQPMLTDFGVAKILDIDEGQTLTGTGVGVGTPKYMAPEQWKNKVVPQTDVYALGVVLYEMVTGRVPYNAETPAGVLEKQLTEPLVRPRELNPAIPDEVERVLYKALAKDPLQRYMDMGQFAIALERLTQPTEDVTSDSEMVQSQVRQKAVRPFFEKAQPEKVAASGVKTSWVLGVLLLGLVVVIVVLVAMLNGVGKTPMQATEIPKVVGNNPTALPPTEIAIVENRPTPLPPTAALVSAPIDVKVSKNEKDGAEMVYVPAGEFLMGSENGNSDEKPQHTVYLDEYWIYKTEVTNAQYGKCVGAGTCNEPGDTMNYKDSSYAQHPVMYVDWEQAKGYCAWAGSRFPNEAEWEKAARGTTDGRTYPWGNQEPTCELANFSSCGVNTKEVGSLSQGASPYGVLDMAGNAWEWVNDWYAEGYYEKSVRENPAGPDTGDYHIVRGGSWLNGQRYLRASNRRMYNPADRYLNSGFRCVHSPSKKLALESSPTTVPPTVQQKIMSPTITPIPQSDILYVQDFEQNDLKEWYTSNGKFTVKDEDGNHFWEGTGEKDFPQAWLFSPQTEKWTDYAFESRIRIVKGAVFICLRSVEDGSSFYNAYINPNDSWFSFADYGNAKYLSFGERSLSTNLNQWYTMRFEVQGEQLRFYIDDKLVASATRTSHTNGDIGYYMGGGNIIDIDDIRVWKLSD